MDSRFRGSDSVFEFLRSIISNNKILKQLNRRGNQTMLNKNPKKSPKLIIALIVFSLSIFYVPTQSMLMANPAIQENVPSSEGSKPIIVYYSRTGKTRIVANTLNDQLSCEIEEIKSTEDREGFWGVITCVLDSLLDRDDVIEPFNKDLKGYNPIIIASPIWIGKLSSPARTFIKQSGLNGKEVYIVLTYNGSLTEEKENILKEGLTSQGTNLKELYKVVTKEKTDEEIKKDISTQLEKRPIATKKVASGTL
jgi:flavodoxin